MKELIINEETLDIVRQMVADGQVSQEVAEKYFPELKESEGEKIRKDLIDFLEYYRLNNVLDSKTISLLTDSVDWLEKQSKQGLPITNERVWLYLISDVLTWKDGIGQYLDDPRVQTLAKKLCDEYSQKLYNFPISSNSSNIRNNKKEPNDKVEPRFKVKYAGSEHNVFEVKNIGSITYYGIEDEPNHIDYVKADSCEIISDDNDIKENGFSIPTKSILFSDKAEPKFKIEEGKWYVCTQTFVLRGKIVVIKGSTYQAREDNAICGEDGCLFIDKHDGKASEYFRLWTIQDIKDGDILFTSSTASHETFIFKSIDERGNVKCYFAYDSEDGFREGKYHFIGKPTFMTHPATKEQRDLLFQKMHEAGYKWDAEKKELKKIEKIAAWSEKDKEMSRFIGNAITADDSSVYLKSKGIEVIDAHVWLDELKDRVQPQPKQEWSEDDEKIWKEISDMLWEGYTQSCSNFTWDDIRDWVNPKIKSIRSQNAWKPSDEQLKALKEAVDEHFDIDGGALWHLYEDLKKLREE